MGLTGLSTVTVVPSISANPLQVGASGVKLKDSSSILEVRNSADDAYVIVRGLTPSGSADLTTKAYVDSLAGTSATSFAIDNDNTGPLLKNSGGALQVRNAADGAMVTVEVATPTTGGHAMTKTLHDSEDAQNIKVISIPIADPAGAYTSTATIPANSRVLRVDKTISEVFDGTPTVTVGYTGSLSAFAGTADTDLTSATTQILSMNKASDSSARTVICTVGGTPAQGAGVIYVHFVESTIA